MELKTAAFAEGDPIPAKHTCAGDDVSPKLEWSGVPGNAEELMLIVDDPDSPGGIWVHWVIAGLDPSSRGLEEGEVPPGAVEGVNDFERMGYGGPCPPVGHGPHRYVFHLYALSSGSGLLEGMTAGEARRAVQDKVIEEARYMGTFERRG
jgi:Raf kinase inhibitor-like YbhB/YbcL family protein